MFFLRLEADQVQCSVNNGGCEYTCDDSSGSVKCSCPTGYELADDNTSCNGEEITSSMYEYTVRHVDTHSHNNNIMDSLRPNFPASAHLLQRSEKRWPCGI